MVGGVEITCSPPVPLGWGKVSQYFFFQSLGGLLKSAPFEHSIVPTVLRGDLNPRFFHKSENQQGVIGRKGRHNLSPSGVLLVHLCVSHRVVAPPHQKEPFGCCGIQSGCLLDISQWRCFRHVLSGGGLEGDPGLAGEIISLGLFGNSLESFWKIWRGLS